jgi:UDP-N-acetylglucosamine/UDP-N-acetylgalactosamine diphosphorylase
MNETTTQNILATKQKYLQPLLGQEIPQKLEEQLDGMDWSYLSLVHNREPQKRGAFAPLGAMELAEIRAREKEFREAGLDAMRQGKVGAILLAGGQGTRLGFDRAKGMYNIGVTKCLYIFEQLIANLTQVKEEVGAWIPLYIMTSDKNDQETRAFFAEHDYFG